MINHIINEDDYIRESKEAIKQLLKRNNLWDNYRCFEENLRQVTVKGYEVRRIFDADYSDFSMYVHYQLVGALLRPTDVDRCGMGTQRRIVDNIKWRITGKI